MNVRTLLLVCLFNFVLSAGLYAQNLFQEKIEICSKEQFCMDCGTPKATVDSFTLSGIADRINYRYNLRGGSGTITFQVLVDAAGNSCVLSHDDASHSPLTNDLMVALNTCIWKPARVDGKPVNASVNVVFTIAYGKITGRMLRMDLAELTVPDSAVVYNKLYQYHNPSLSSYSISVLTKYNSPLPDNVSQVSLMDKTDTLWYATAKGMIKYDGKFFYPINGYNSPFALTPDVSAIAMDKDNNKWLYANRNVYMYGNKGWQMFDPAQFGISKPYNIITTATGELFLPNSKGLLILRNGKFRLIDNQAILDLPSNNVHYAYYDTKGRLWIGTDKGSIMLDKKQKVKSFNGTRTPLDNVCITNVTEDEKGNLYFSMDACKKPAGDNDEEGLAVMSADGKWAHYNDKNSGMPANHINSMLYDKFEHVLWMGTDKSGLVRFDLKNGWENYHNNNSTIPGRDVYQVMQDSKGTIYAATANGLLKIVKK